MRAPCQINNTHFGNSNITTLAYLNRQSTVFCVIPYSEVRGTTYFVPPQRAQSSVDLTIQNYADPPRSARSDQFDAFHSQKEKTYYPGPAPNRSSDTGTEVLIFE